MLQQPELRSARSGSFTCKHLIFSVIVFACLSSGSWIEAQSAKALPETSLHQLHDALFASFLPIDELPTDPQTTALLKTARDAIWQQISHQYVAQQLLTPFANLHILGASCGVRGVLDGTDGSFAAISLQKRQRVLFLLQTCAASVPRRLADTVRNFYIVKGYGAVQGELTGLKLDLFAPHTYIESHTPHLQPTRLLYNRASKELVEKDGRSIDVVIVGSGPAGSVLAHELRRNGRRVVLLERGSLIVPGSMETRLIDDLIDTRTSEDGLIHIRNGMAVGGGSQVNVDLCFDPTSEPIRAKIESWRKAGRIAPDQFTKAELTDAYDWVKRMIGTRTLTEGEINHNNQVLWNGAKLSGLHPRLYSLNTYAPGRSPSRVTDKRSAESQLLIAALENPMDPLGIVPDADVRRVLFTNEGNGPRHAIGVEVQMRAAISEAGALADPNNLKIPVDEIFTLHARTVILCAGALGSPAILLRSGLKNDQIGAGIILHPSMPVMGRFDHHIDALTGVQASVYVDDRLIPRGYAFEAMADQPLYAALMSPGPALHSYEMIKAFRNLAGFGVMLIDTPQNSNRILLDRSGAPEVHYTLSDPDKRRLAEGLAEAIRIMFKAGAKEVYLPTTENLLDEAAPAMSRKPLILRSPGQAAMIQKNIQFVANRTIISSAHMQSTNKMGFAAQNSVVGQDFHVWGTQDLYVVDGSIFPTSIGANPMQSIYTIAKIFADHWNKQ